VTTINRATWTDDDGSGTTGTIINNARLQGDVYDRVDAALATLDAKDASQDTNIAANGPHKILSSQHSDVTPATLVPGDLLIVDGTGKLVRLPKAADGQMLTLAAGLPAWLPGGNWTDVPFNAANFTADSGAWTVTAGNISSLRYLIFGKLFFITFQIQGTNVTTGSPVIRMMVPNPAGGQFVSLAGTVYNPITAFSGSWNIGSAGNTGGTAIQIFFYPNPAKGAWPAYTNTIVSGQLTVPLA
jgi:hypothetical protein